MNASGDEGRVRSLCEDRTVHAVALILLHFGSLQGEGSKDTSSVNFGAVVLCEDVVDLIVRQRSSKNI